ncbi:MAG: hypothetical protein U5K69_25375 [Balneolaceae bacterium]|nr:hypothetical protein [Balneolaceae bacterium]
MIRSLNRPLLTVLILLFAASSLHATQDQTSEEEATDIPIDVIGKVQDHNYLDIAGYHLELPHILLVDGEWHFYSSTQAAVESGNFVEENHTLVPADGSEITLDLSITSHLMYFWFRYCSNALDDHSYGSPLS